MLNCHTWSGSVWKPWQVSTGNSACGCLVTTTGQLIMADRISTDFALLSDSAFERVLRLARAMYDAGVLNWVLT